LSDAKMTLEFTTWRTQYGTACVEHFTCVSLATFARGQHW